MCLLAHHIFNTWSSHIYFDFFRTVSPTSLCMKGLEFAAVILYWWSICSCVTSEYNLLSSDSESRTSLTKVNIGNTVEIPTANFWTFWKNSEECLNPWTTEDWNGDCWISGTMLDTKFHWWLSLQYLNMASSWVAILPYDRSILFPQSLKSTGGDLIMHCPC